MLGILFVHETGEVSPDQIKALDNQVILQDKSMAPQIQCKN